MAQSNQGPVERRRAARAALHVNATLRDGSRKAPARVIDMSTGGCRVECSTVVDNGSKLWLGIEGLANQYCRVVWHCEEFIGLEFETPISEAVFDQLLRSQSQLAEKEIQKLRGMARRTHWLARKADDSDIAILADISRQCAENAAIEGLRLGQSGKFSSKRK